MSEGAAATGGGEQPLIIGRYALFEALAAGGMATVHLGRLLGPVGFGRTVAVKRLHSQYATDQDFVTMFLDEARIVARIRHPNVVPMVDVIESSKGLFLVMEYVHGESYSKLLRAARAKKEMIPLKIITAVMQGLLLGLHAAHETKGPNGELLDVVHRDVSPQNIMVGADGVARVLDFGVAKAAGRAQVTREGQIKGKLAYMAPEQIRGIVDRRADVFAAAVVLWESLAGRRLHEGAKDVEIVTRVVQGDFPPPSRFRPDIPPELDEIVMRGLEVELDRRYQNARQMALELERKIGLASPTEIGEWVEHLSSEVLRKRADMVAATEKASASLLPSDSVPPPRPTELEERPVVSVPHPGSVTEEAAAPVFEDHGQKKNASGAQPPFVPPPGPSSLSPNDPLFRPSVQFGTETTSRTAATPMSTEMPPRPMPMPPRPERDLAPMIAALSFCGMLAVVGIVLVVLSLYARRPVAPAPSSASAPPSVSAAPPLRPSPLPSASHTTIQEAPAAGASNAAAVDAGAPVLPVRHRVPAPAKKACDPPYDTDDAGHRHYKIECLSPD